MMENFIRVYDNALPKNACEYIISQFEVAQDEHIIRDVNDYIKFTEINTNKSSRWSDVVTYLFGIGNQYVEQYKKDCDVHEKQFPEEYGWEEMRIKRYHPNQHDEFALHVDADDYASARRFLVFFWYLNDVEEGGETVFGKDESIKVTPKEGRLLIFPPTWTYLHAGKKPISNTKYIIGSYMHFL